ncbi:MAG: PBP1A family penicillin-binding protein [Parvibaculum sp.]|uniref:transglycosylase domain-containing protein n=1 Tax=Parvibaculum sp. TaxID=2024848 RepID=UPI0025DE73E0|nr:PBP1A family penicillin-binding protein [Parvibaculum sp.]MCE9649559.1 PBP1A family penicillin-binding protein [Parvibaculum sp.]
MSDHYQDEDQLPEDDAPPSHDAGRARRRRPLWLRLASFAITAGFIAAALLVFVTIPKLQRDIEAGPASALALTVLDADGNEIGSRGGSTAPIVPLAELPPYLVKAFLATEDRRFYSHFGIDLHGVARAMWANLRSGGFVEGGSTITQQLAKNLYLDSDRTLWRKAQEALIALWLESNYTKDEILTLYLNRVYMGAGNYGIDAAAHYYFGKSARDVSLPEAAVLAGLPKAPSRFAPTNDLALAQARAAVVLDRLVDTGDLTPAEAAEARAHPAVVAARDKRDGPQYFVDWVAGEVRQLLPEASGRLTVHTTLNPKRQRAAEEAIAAALKNDGGGRHVGQGAAIALAPNGAILAMIGGKSYLESQFNRATQAERQPGSAFKAVVYLAALEQGMTPFSEIEDSPVALGEWAPQNSNAKFAGTVTLADALARSINTVAVKLAERVGVKAIANTAARLGISSPIQSNLSIALGSSEVTLLELTSAYSTFATDGRRAIPFGVTEIVSLDGETLYKNTPASVRVTDETYAHQMTYMLRRVVTSGTGLRADPGDRAAAGKTGTSQDNRDAWFVGYTANETVGVWFGNDDNSATKGAAGGNFAALAWRNYMKASQKGVPPSPLPGADDAMPVAREQQRTPIKGFLSQLADLFSAAPRLEEDSNLSSGPRRDAGGLQTGGGRPK